MIRVRAHKIALYKIIKFDRLKIGYKRTTW